MKAGNYSLALWQCEDNMAQRQEPLSENATTPAFECLHPNLKIVYIWELRELQLKHKTVSSNEALA